MTSVTFFCKNLQNIDDVFVTSVKNLQNIGDVSVTSVENLHNFLTGSFKNSEDYY